MIDKPARSAALGLIVLPMFPILYSRQVEPDRALIGRYAWNQSLALPGWHLAMGTSMRVQLSCAAIALLVLAAGQAQAQSTSGAPVPGSIGIRISPFAGVENPLADPGFLTGQENGKDKEKEPKGKTQPPVEPPDDFAQSAPESAEASRGLNPRTISDLPAFFTVKTVML